jgi:hypothetical protein
MILTLNPFHKTPEIVDPVGPETELSNLASEFYLCGETAKAITMVELALKIARTVPVLVNMAVILESLGRFDEAFKYAEEAYKLNPADKRTINLYAEALLRRGDLAQGWPLYSQSRNTRSQLKDFIPEWTDQGLSGKRLLVVEGEGYGDNIYFLRWLAALRDLGAELDYICQPTLAPLVEHMGFRPLENWGGNVDFRFTDYDYHVSILTLPQKFGVTYDNYQWNGPYVVVGAPVRRKIAGEPLRVGICSLAGEGMSARRQRSLHASQLQPLMNSLDPRHKWVNLHHHYILPDTVDHPIVETWLDTAKAISTCDLVVSVDTAVAHLAAAMGIVTWVMLPGASAWHYPLYRPDHPFYPSMRMFRNQAEGLDFAVQFVSAELNRL